MPEPIPANDASQPAEEAIAIIRRLAAADPAFLHDLVTSLRVFASTVPGDTPRVEHAWASSIDELRGMSSLWLRAQRIAHLRFDPGDAELIAVAQPSAHTDRRLIGEARRTVSGTLAQSGSGLPSSQANRWRWPSDDLIAWIQRCLAVVGRPEERDFLNDERGSMQDPGHRRALEQLVFLYPEVEQLSVLLIRLDELQESPAPRLPDFTGGTASTFRGATAAAIDPAEADVIPQYRRAAPSFKVVVGGNEAAGVAIPVPVGPTGDVAPGELAARQFEYLGTGGSVAIVDHWIRLSLPLQPGASFLVHRWVELLRGDATIGFVPLRCSASTALAWAPGTELPDQVVLRGHPFPAAWGTTSVELNRDLRPLHQLAEAQRLARAGWWQWRLQPGARPAELCEAAVGWVGLGEIQRAAFVRAMLSADLRHELAASAGPVLAPRIDAALARYAQSARAGGVVPNATELRRTPPLPLWAVFDPTARSEGIAP